MNTTQILEVIKTKEKDYDFNDYIENYIDIDQLKEIEDLESLRDYLNELNEEQQITDTQVIYYASAMDYLREHDNSLTESIEIACEYGFELSKINSELLASLLKSRNNVDDYNTFIDEVISELE